MLLGAGQKKTKRLYLHRTVYSWYRDMFSGKIPDPRTKFWIMSIMLVINWWFDWYLFFFSNDVSRNFSHRCQSLPNKALLERSCYYSTDSDFWYRLENFLKIMLWEMLRGGVTLPLFLHNIQTNKIFKQGNKKVEWRLWSFMTWAFAYKDTKWKEIKICCGPRLESLLMSMFILQVLEKH